MAHSTGTDVHSLLTISLQSASV